MVWKANRLYAGTMDLTSFENRESVLQLSTTPGLCKLVSCISWKSAVITRWAYHWNRSWAVISTVCDRRGSPTVQINAHVWYASCWRRVKHRQDAEAQLRRRKPWKIARNQLFSKNIVFERLYFVRNASPAIRRWTRHTTTKWRRFRRRESTEKSGVTVICRSCLTSMCSSGRRRVYSAVRRF